MRWTKDNNDSHMCLDDEPKMLKVGFVAYKMKWNTHKKETVDVESKVWLDINCCLEDF